MGSGQTTHRVLYEAQDDGLFVRVRVRTQLRKISRCQFTALRFGSGMQKHGAHAYRLVLIPGSDGMVDKVVLRLGVGTLTALARS